MPMLDLHIRFKEKALYLGNALSALQLQNEKAENQTHQETCIIQGSLSSDSEAQESRKIQGPLYYLCLDKLSLFLFGKELKKKAILFQI